MIFMGKKLTIQPVDISLFISRFIEVAEKANTGKDYLSLAVFNKGNKFQEIVNGSASMNIPTFNKVLYALDEIEKNGFQSFIANKKQQKQQQKDAQNGR